MGRLGTRLPQYPIGTKGVTDVGHFEDNEYFYFGTGDDVALYWDGSNFLIDPATGDTITMGWSGDDAFIYFGTATTQDGKLQANTADDYSRITIGGNDDISLNVPATKAIACWAGTGHFLDIHYGSSIPTVEAIATNGDVYLKPNGTGKVRFGTKTATGDTATDGYVTVKDAAGNTIKLATVA